MLYVNILVVYLAPVPGTACPAQAGGSGADGGTIVHRSRDVRGLASQGAWCRPEVIRTMQDTIQTIQQALDVLLEEGWTLFRGTIQGQEGAHTLSFMNRHMPYQAWYTKALRFIRQLYPERSDDFQAHYRELLALQRSTPFPPLVSQSPARHAQTHCLALAGYQRPCE